jgi:hypothetical protein
MKKLMWMPAVRTIAQWDVRVSYIGTAQGRCLHAGITENLYDLLGVESTATSVEIKQAFKKVVLRTYSATMLVTAHPQGEETEVQYSQNVLIH